VRVKSTPDLKVEKAGTYSIYIIFPRTPGKDEGGMRVYAGQAISEDAAVERACAILDEQDGGARAVEVIDWGRANDVTVRRIDRDNRPIAW
jgi:hypothetical protein